MIKLTVLFVACFFIACSSKSVEKSPLITKTVLADELKEISGITASGEFLWAITDKPKARVFKLDKTGKLIQTVNITNVEATDVEAVASDSSYVYIGDVGDNIGDREDRKIFKISTSNAKSGQTVDDTCETIEFTFPDEGQIEKKKQNNFDCESLMSFQDSLYVFTKDREDKETKLYVVPKVAGKYTARFISSFNSDGLITDAAINKHNNEVALIGYHKKHLYPFIYIFNNFHGNDFFSGDHKKIELADKPWDWQLEGITYDDKDVLYFSCEGTKQVKATFYGIKRGDLFKLKKEKQNDNDDETNNDEPELTKKGHLKM